VWGPLALAFFFAALHAGMAFADVADDVSRVFELSEKLRPGMTIQAINELLGPPEEEYRLQGKAAGTVRYQWVHGIMGVAIYEVEGSAYRVDITLPCGNASETTKAMGAMERMGNRKYGTSAPSLDRLNGHYYWVRDGIRFAYSKYNSTTVQSSCTLAH